MRTGGNPVDPGEVVLYSVLSAAACLAVWWYEQRVAARIDSQLVRNDAREWMIGTLFSVVTLAGFVLVWLLPEPWAQWWARYADSAVLALMALLLLPVPAKILVDNMREVLRMANPDDVVSQRVRAAMREAAAQYDIADYSTHIAKTGRIYVVEINIVVGEAFELRSVPELDTLRSRIWDAIGLPLEQAWLGILFTADPRWSWACLRAPRSALRFRSGWIVSQFGKPPGSAGVTVVVRRFLEYSERGFRPCESAPGCLTGLLTLDCDWPPLRGPQSRKPPALPGDGY